jgi:hypothetical protein
VFFLALDLRTDQEEIENRQQHERKKQSRPAGFATGRSWCLGHCIGDQKTQHF